MKKFLIACALVGMCTGAALAQFSNSHPDGVPMPPIADVIKDRVGGPVAIGQAMAQPNPAGGVTIVQAPNPDAGGGLIQLKVFGWLEPYADALAQALIAAGFAWFMKSKYSTGLDETSRAALETFFKNRASSLIADGFVRMDGKTVDVHSPALAAEAAKGATMVPDALKRFGLTPDVVAQKIVDAIPQVQAGAQIIASAHSGVYKDGDVMIAGNLDNIHTPPSGPPTAAVPA